MYKIFLFVIIFHLVFWKYQAIPLQEVVKILWFFSYLSFYNGISRLRSSHFDRLTIISSVHPKSSSYTATNRNSRSALGNSFFYRTHLIWNNLPFDIRNISDHTKFKDALIKQLWCDISTNLVSSAGSDKEDLLDTG